jgi:Single-stranded DNA-specific exonuclease
VRGSARSYGNIDLYELIRGQEHLLLSMGGHPYAGGLSLLAENLEIFTAAINQKFWSQYRHLDLQPSLNADLVAQVADLNKALFQELKLLEPYGMGNPTPKIMVQQAEFIQKRRADIMDGNKEKVKFTKTEFVLRDGTGTITGVWWGHEPHELPDQPCDVLVEFGYDYYKNRYEVRLEEFRLSAGATRISEPETKQVSLPTPTPQAIDPPATWQTLLGVAKYLHRTGQTTTLAKLQDRLEIWHRPLLHLGLQALKGIEIEQDRVFCRSAGLAVDETCRKRFIAALQELNFRCSHRSGTG